MEDMIKKLLFFAATALMLNSCSDIPVAVSEVPGDVQTFIKQYFPGQTITYAEKDWSWFSYKYEVVLADGTHMKFDTDNAWDMIESPMNGVPVAVLPPVITNYMNTNYPGVAVKKIDKENYGYEVELVNELEFKFNEQGALMEMDD